MLSAFLIAALGASTLLVGALISLAVEVPRRVMGLVMAFGAGVLISAVAYELALEAFTVADRAHGPALGFFAGVLAFAAGNLAIDRAGGRHRKRIAGPGNALAVAMVLGVVLDSIPESAVLGMTLAESGAVVAILVAVAMSNLPEGMAASAGLRRAGHGAPAIIALWVGVIAVCGLAGGLGFVLLEGASPGVVGFVLAFAGGAILTMLAQTMMPEAFAEGGRLTGIVTSLGFAVAFAISSI